jgi:hypothetical protein
VRTYLGDGVYGELDGSGAVWLVTSDGARDTNRICLEPEVLQAMDDWIECLEAHAQRHPAAHREDGWALHSPAYIIGTGTLEQGTPRPHRRNYFRLEGQHCCLGSSTRGRLLAFLGADPVELAAGVGFDGADGWLAVQGDVRDHGLVGQRVTLVFEERDSG